MPRKAANVHQHDKKPGKINGLLRVTPGRYWRSRQFTSCESRFFVNAKRHSSQNADRLREGNTLENAPTPGKTGRLSRGADALSRKGPSASSGKQAERRPARVERKHWRQPRDAAKQSAKGSRQRPRRACGAQKAENSSAARMRGKERERGENPSNPLRSSRNPIPPRLGE